MEPDKLQGASKIPNGRSTTVHNHLSCAYTLCMKYVTKMFLLVSPSDKSKQLLRFLYGQGQNNEQKHATKNFFRFHNHSSLLPLCPFKTVK